MQFSQAWIKQNESNSPNPVSEILFRRFMDDMERDIARRTRKRIFEAGAKISLKPETIQGVVKKDGFDPIVLQLILRSPEIRSDILLSSSGANRTRTRWDLIRDLRAPYPGLEVVQEIRQMAERAEAAKREAVRLLQESRASIQRQLHLETEDASMVLTAFRPPK